MKDQSLSTTNNERKHLTGLSGSQGVAVGQVYVYDRVQKHFPHKTIADDEKEPEVQRVKDAIQKSVSDLSVLRQKLLSQGIDDSGGILDAHLMMMQDPLLFEETRKGIIDDNHGAEWALQTAIKKIQLLFQNMGDDYLKERHEDVQFVGERIFSTLQGHEAPTFDDLPAEAVVVGHDLAPADFLVLAKKRIAAVVIEKGGRASHTSILARAHRIPAVVGCKQILEMTDENVPIIVDGSRGDVILNPTTEDIQTYQALRESAKARWKRFRDEAHEPATTPDGQRVYVLANIEVANEVEPALKAGATGIGLYRTEFLYMDQDELPDVSKHVNAYTSIYKQLAEEQPAIFRTFDIGGDKLSKHFPPHQEDNPALGLRATRFALKYPEVLRIQLRGLLKASSCKRGAILFPMIGSVEEFRWCKKMLQEEAHKLKAAGHEVWDDIPLGAMIELPAAVWIADKLAKECDFFSVGTNDLLQYSLAVDRGNEELGRLYTPFGPSNLAMLAHLVEAGRKAGIPVSLCGEMASEPLLTPICIALGFSSISVNLSMIPRVKWLIRRISLSEAQAILQKCLAMDTAKEVRHYLIQEMTQRFPEMKERLETRVEDK
ncbi:MAG: phosphoenolpyruvate--protein phosphotransferase [Myxococcales bacterium]|nr:phosphoenolpyruvate--protein phosphotransferase [Myxococcales bacterium]|tara:strand:+ start:2395 stop:4203 length:1809 start_codon:yes stop_codon:yes gene_type:complete